MKRLDWKNILTLAFTIALLPPLWAVLSPLFGVTTGAVALICAGLYVAAGNTVKKAPQITVGFLCGDAWAVLAVFIMENLELPPSVELYCTLFVLGFVAVVVASVLERFILLPAWLCGWAIGLTIMGPLAMRDIGSLPLQIGAAMVAGVWYVGVVGDLFQKLLLKLCGSSGGTETSKASKKER